MISLGVVFCRSDDNNFVACPDCIYLRAVGNLSPDYPNEELYLKACKLLSNPLGTCEHQLLLDRFPRVSAFFYKKGKNKEKS